jgi:hypothetical protein
VGSPGAAPEDAQRLVRCARRAVGTPARDGVVGVGNCHQTAEDVKRLSAQVRIATTAEARVVLQGHSGGSFLPWSPSGQDGQGAFLGMQPHLSPVVVRKAPGLGEPRIIEDDPADVVKEGAHSQLHEVRVTEPYLPA